VSPTTGRCSKRLGCVSVLLTSWLLYMFRCAPGRYCVATLVFNIPVAGVCCINSNKTRYHSLICARRKGSSTLTHSRSRFRDEFPSARSKYSLRGHSFSKARAQAWQHRDSVSKWRSNQAGSESRSSGEGPVRGPLPNVNEQMLS
jgi:hypothetical protein